VGSNTKYPAAPSFAVSGGGGGVSASAAMPSGDGGYVQLSTPDSGFYVGVSSFTLTDFGIGGTGFSGCGGAPFQGGPGGSAGTVPGQNTHVSLATQGWKLVSGGQLADLVPVNVGFSCSGGDGGKGSNSAPGGKHGATDAGTSLGLDGNTGTLCSGSAGCNGGVLAKTYQTTPLNFEGIAFNNSGHVVGRKDTMAVFWDGTNLTMLGPGAASAINNGDAVVGSDGASGTAWYWTKATGRTVLQAPPGTFSVVATCINANGMIAGYYIQTAQSFPTPVVWQSFQSGAAKLALDPKILGAYARAINDNGVIAGDTGVDPIRWDSPSAPSTLLSDLAPAGRTHAVRIYAVNAAGDVFGAGAVPQANLHPMTWRAGATTGVDLVAGDASDSQGWIEGVNSAGSLVGSYAQFGAAFDGTNALVLNARVSNLSTAGVIDALAINDCGQILVATSAGTAILTPQ